MESVLASAPAWVSDQAPRLCRLAGEIADLLSDCEAYSQEARQDLRVRAALLYDLSESPAMSSAVLDEGDLVAPLENLLERKGAFSRLGANGDDGGPAPNGMIENVATLVDEILSHDASMLAAYEQGDGDTPSRSSSSVLAKLARETSIGRTATELEAFVAVLSRRIAFATRTNVDGNLFEALKEIQFPAELWPTQVRALHGGLAEAKYPLVSFSS